MLSKTSLKVILFSSAAVIGIAVLVYFLFAKGRVPEYATIIPEKTAFVARFDYFKMSGKVDFATVKEMGFYKDMKKQMQEQDPKSYQLYMEIEKDIAVTGINVTQPLLAFAYKGDAGGVFCIAASVDNKDNLRKFSEKAGSKVGEQDGIFFIDEQEVMVWNDATVLYVKTEDGLTATAKGEGISILNGGKGRKLTEANNDFASFLSNSGDIDLWLDYASMPELMEQGMMTQAAILPINIFAIQGTMHAHLNFEEGKITASSKIKLDENSQYLNDDMDKKILDYVPGKNALLALGGSVNMDKILSDSTIKPQLPMVADQFGLTEDEVKKLLQGDMALSVYKMAVDTTAQNAVPLPGIALVLRSAAPDAVHKMLNGLIDQSGGAISKEKDYYKVAIPFISTMYLKQMGDYFVLTNDTRYLNLTEAPEKSGEVGDQLRTLAGKGSAFGAVYFEQLRTFLKESQLTDDLDKSLGLMNQAYFTGNLTGGEGVLLFNNSKENGLMGMFRLLEESYQEQQAGN